MKLLYSMILLSALQPLCGMSEESERLIVSLAAKGAHTYLTENFRAINDSKLDAHLRDISDALTATHLGPQYLLELKDCRDPKKEYFVNNFFNDRHYGTITYWDPTSNEQKTRFSAHFYDLVTSPLTVSTVDATNPARSHEVVFSRVLDERNHVLSYNLLALLAQCKQYPQILRMINRCDAANNPMMKPCKSLGNFNEFRNLVAGESDVNFAYSTHLILEKLNKLPDDEKFKLLYTIYYPWYERMYESATATTARLQISQATILAITSALLINLSRNLSQHKTVQAGLQALGLPPYVPALAGLASGGAAVWKLAAAAVSDVDFRPESERHLPPPHNVSSIVRRDQ